MEEETPPGDAIPVHDRCSHSVIIVIAAQSICTCVQRHGKYVMSTMRPGQGGHKIT